MIISDQREGDVKLTLNDCIMGDVVELDGLDGVFLVTDYFDNKTRRLVRLNDGYIFDVKIVSVAHSIRYQFIITDKED